MNKRIVYKDAEGTKVVVPAQAAFDSNSFDYKSICNQTGKKTLTDSDIIEFIKSKAIPENTENHIIEDKDLPVDRYFRNAWEINNSGKIFIDIKKAKDIKKQYFRDIRKPLLEMLDIKVFQADEAGDLVKKAKLVKMKADLRNVTDMKLPDDEEELKSLMPDILKEDYYKDI